MQRRSRTVVAFRNSKVVRRSGRGDESSARASGMTKKLREGAQAATDQVRHTAAEVTRVITDTLQDEASRLFYDQRGRAAKRVARMGKVARQAAHALHAVKMGGVADYADAAAQRVEDLSDYINEKDLTELLRDAQDAARAHPAAAMGGMFLVGFAAARFLKASASRDEGGDDEDEDDKDDAKGRSRSNRNRRR
jgi:hypothetical protein